MTAQLLNVLLTAQSLVTLRSCSAKGAQASSWRGSSGSSTCCPAAYCEKNSLCTEAWSSCPAISFARAGEISCLTQKMLFCCCNVTYTLPLL